MQSFSELEVAGHMENITRTQAERIVAAQILGWVLLQTREVPPSSSPRSGPACTFVQQAAPTPHPGSPVPWPPVHSLGNSVNLRKDGGTAVVPISSSQSSFAALSTLP